MKPDLRCRLSTTCLLLLGFMVPAAVWAADMHDDTIRITLSTGLFGVQITARMYAPDGNGPFPLVVINHGKAEGNPHFQADKGYYLQAREFVKRGYAVLVPTRQGYGTSGGGYRHAACNATKTGELQADDIESAIKYAKTLPYIDGNRIVVIGQSVGGLATMALGERHIPGVLGLIDMAGGIRMDNCAAWEQSDIDAFTQYGQQSRTPALLMYGDNDTYWGPTLPKQMFDAYIAAGGKATFIDYGTFENDSHNTFPHPAGKPLWLPAFTKFFTSLGLPFDEKYDLHSDAPGGDVAQIDAVPYLSRGSKIIYAEFLDSDPRGHRAFALSPDGHSGYAVGPNAEQQALALCAKHTQMHCTLYAVDQKVVYQTDSVAAQP
jgi:dienelactone hydrolase